MGKRPSFGDKVINICAGRENPYRIGYFVRQKKDTYQITDKRGDFWESMKRVVYPYSEALERLDPVHPDHLTDEHLAIIGPNF